MSIFVYLHILLSKEFENYILLNQTLHEQSRMVKQYT